MRVTLLYWPECQSHDIALERLKRVLSEEGIHAEIEVVAVTSEDQAKKTGFGGSPTILLDGKDIDPASRDEAGRLSCRTYKRSDGSLGPLPDIENIRAALRARAKGVDSL